jgi:uncharacterized membrane protein YciS (DUF1049 family)
MKHFTLALCAALVVGLGLAPVHQVGAADEQYVNDADIKVLSDADTALVALGDVFEKADVTLEEFKAASTNAQAKLDTVAAHTFTDQLGEKYVTTAGALKTKAGDLKKAIGELAIAYESGDEAAVSTKHAAFTIAATEYDKAFLTFNDSIDENNDLVAQGKNTEVAYLAAVLVTGLITAVTFLWAFLKKHPIVQLNEAKKSVALSSIWPLVGAAITFISYRMAATGGTYTIAWGAVVVGAVFYIKALVDYFKLKKQFGAGQVRPPQNPSATV